nr:unnamed protein product [Callosobruchus analis]
MPNFRKRHRDRSHSNSEERDNLSLVLKRIEHHLGRLEQRRKRRRRRSGTPSYSDDSRSYRSRSESSSSSYADPIDQATLDVENTHRPVFTSPVAACWTRIRRSGLAIETKENMIKKYLPPENCQELSPPPLINPEVKRASPENSVRRDARIAQLQQQIGAATLNKDFKEALKDSPIEKWLFGSNLDTTLKTAKELKKSTEQLKVPKENYRVDTNELPEELLTNKTFSASDREAGQGERQKKSPLVLEAATPCGRLRYFIPRWKNFSFHKKILSYINDVSIPLCAIPKQTFIPSETQRSKKENKIEDYRAVAHLITPNAFMATIDLKNAYYLKPVMALLRAIKVICQWLTLMTYFF